MSRSIPDQLFAFPLVPFFLGGCLALLPDSTPAQAQVTKDGFLLAQRTVVNSLPPPPNLQTIPYNQQPLTKPSQLTQTVPWNSYNQNFQSPPRVRVNPYNQNFRPSQTVQANSYTWSAERYLVYVDGGDYQQLQRVRQLESSAYIRHVNGRPVIQSGAFSKPANAQQRVRELELNGIYGARVVRSSSGQQVGYGSGGPYPSDSPNNRNSSRPQRSSYYYVTIPARPQDLSAIASRIRQSSGRYDIVVERQQPLGPHVAVGPFGKREDAERWNDYLRDLGFGNARVYYGK
ncbi:hypothetical protein H6G41_26730 [Tolypothrix sp. FACHB-123]|uniref:hypothetical protein n=1 Tax=Tolypothrix sp. FACHB-123 TaxID=2692868 RepID=UPI001689A9A3|nr:hypothetical protein [Tolypothrix sp. FACHB-123]MBD2358164.1 hypothetical protein [Tolypothrix sp. FACHB-123]